MHIRYWQLALALMVPFFVWSGSRSYKQKIFDQNVTDQLQLVVRSSNTEGALVPLQNALQYLEEQNLADGNTGVLRDSANRDIGAWYDQLIAVRDSLEESADFPIDAQAVVLMRTHQLLIHPNTNKVRTPTAIAVYPHVVWWQLTWWLSALAGVGGLFGLIDKYLLSKGNTSNGQVVQLNHQRPAA